MDAVFSNYPLVDEFINSPGINKQKTVNVKVGDSLERGRGSMQLAIIVTEWCLQSHNLDSIYSDWARNRTQIKEKKLF